MRKRDNDAYLLTASDYAGRVSEVVEALTWQGRRDPFIGLVFAGAVFEVVYREVGGTEQIRITNVGEAEGVVEMRFDDHAEACDPPLPDLETQRKLMPGALLQFEQLREMLGT